MGAVEKWQWPKTSSINISRGLMGGHDGTRELPAEPGSQSRHEWRRDGDSAVLRYQLVLLLQCTLDKQKKPWHPAKTNNIMTIRVSRLSLHRPVAEPTAPLHYYCKGSLSSRNSSANVKGRENKISDYIKYGSFHLCIVGDTFVNANTHTVK